MPHKYLIKTQTGNTYEIEDATHLFGSDHWVSMVNGIRQALLCFGDLRAATMEHAFPTTGWTNPDGTTEIRYLRVLEGQIGNALRTKSCIGQRMVFIEEYQFRHALQWVEQLNIANKANNRPRMTQLWSTLSKSVHYSTPVVEIYQNF